MAIDNIFNITRLKEVPKEFYNKILLFNTHCDLGDNIICKGIVNYYLNYYDYIIIPIFERYRSSMEHLYDTSRCILVAEDVINDMLYTDNYPYFTRNNVLFLGNKMHMNGSRRLPEKYLRIHMPFWEYNLPFTEAYYKQANVPYDYSYTKFNIFKRDIEEENKLLEKFKDEYIFLHEDYPRAFLIKDEYKPKNYIYPDYQLTRNIFNWIPVIQKCKEIHCIDSSFLNLIDRIELNDDVRLYYHAYAKDSPHPSLRKNWKNLD